MCSLDDAHATSTRSRAWARALAAAGAAERRRPAPAPPHAAQRGGRARRARTCPSSAHLHGTELLMLEAIEARRRRAGRTRDAWAERMRAGRRAASALIVLSDIAGRARRAAARRRRPSAACEVAERLRPATLHAPRRSTAAPTGAATSSRSRRAGRPAASPGSVRYARGRPRGVRRDATDPVLLYVGRFTEVKRVAAADRGLRARARAASPGRAPLVLLGGFPGEWEGEHPLETIARTGARDVFLAGWHGHDELPAFLSAVRRRRAARPCASSSARCSSRGWRAGCRRSRSTRYGPAEIVDARRDRAGWSRPTTATALANALVEAVNRPGERRRRGERGRAEVARARYAWPALAQRGGGGLRQAARRGHGRARCGTRRRLTAAWSAATFPLPHGAHAAREHPLAATPAADRAGRTVRPELTSTTPAASRSSRG